MLPELVPSGCMPMPWGYIHVWNCEKVQNLSPCPGPGVRWALQDVGPLVSYAVKILKIETPENIAVITLKIEHCGFAVVMCADQIANSVDQDQTAPQSDLGLHCLLRPVCPKI